MEEVPCGGCSTFFEPRNRSQGYCSNPSCKQARKTLWQKNKMATDPEYKEGQKLSQKKWAKSKPGYWKDYRHRHPEKAERNRILQKIRNMRKRSPVGKSMGIAKMDSGTKADFMCYRGEKP